MNSSTWKIFITALAIIAILGSCTTDRTRAGYLRTMAETLGAPPRPVIVIPGFGVSRLYDPVRRVYVWGTGHATFRTNYEDDLDLPEGGHDRLVPRGATPQITDCEEIIGVIMAGDVKEWLAG